MSARPRHAPLRAAAGLTLVEVMIALLVLTVGIMAVAKLFPAGTRSQLSARMEDVAGGYASEQFEKLRGLATTSSALSVGRHPSSGFDTLGTSRAWRRYYVVTQMSSPLDSLLKIDCTVQWQQATTDSIHMTGYLFP